jgi:hypothetical protein
MHSLDPMPPLEVPLFSVGRDPMGYWVARSADGREGGLFVSRAEALKFVRKASRSGKAVVDERPSKLTLWS